MFEQIQYKRPLIIGIGGGNDIVSSTLVLSDLIRVGKNPDLAGICSPGAWHLYNGKEEEPVNLVNVETKRYRPSKIRQELSFIDAKIPELLKREGIRANVYNLSCRYGASALINNLEKLIETQGYDGIVAVDVGGDILARGKQDPTILSPLMDFTTLYALSQLEISSVLIEFGLQTDGELRPKGCEEIFEEFNSSNILSDTIKIKNCDKAVEIFSRVYKGIESIRHGHTAHMTLETLTADKDINTEYRMRIQVLNEKWYHNFPITLESKYFGKAFLIDNKKLAKSRKLAFSYESPLELYLKTKKIVNTKTEMDMLYTWADNSCIWLGLLCPQIEGGKRNEILNYGLNNLENYADVALLWKKDATNLTNKRFNIDVDEFRLTGESFKDVEKVAHRVNKILEGSK